MDVNIGAFFKIASHVKVEITNDIHLFFSAFLGVGGAPYQADFLGAPIGIDDGAVELVLTEQTCRLPDACNSSGIVVGPRCANRVGVGGVAVP